MPKSKMTPYFGPQSVHMVCPNCDKEIITTTIGKTSILQWGIFGGLFLSGFCIFLPWLGFCAIPFCVDDCQDVIHNCPYCNFTLGKYNGKC